MKTRKKYVWEQGDTMYIHDTNFDIVRILNGKTKDCRDIENQHMIQKVMENGEELVALVED